MLKSPCIRIGVVWLTSTALVLAQSAHQAPPIRMDLNPPPAPAQKPPAPAAPAQPAPAQPAPAPAAPAPAAPAPQAAAPVAMTDTGGFLLNNVSLVQLIDILAKRLHINYILDPRVKGSVTINTYGEVKPTDLTQLLETILRVNGAAMVKVGNLYRIVPLNVASQLPIKPSVNGDKFDEDERMVLNLVFLKYITVADISKLVQPFLGEAATMATYEPANLLILLDNSRNMNRTMELLAMFDSDNFASKRVRLFDVKNGRPSDIAKELEDVFKSFALSEKNASVKFMPVDRINTIIAVAPNPGIFNEVETWLKKLDIPVKVTAGAVDNYVYRLKYGRAETVAMAIMALYTGGAGMFGMGMMGMGSGGMGYGGMGMGGMGMGYGGMGYGGMGMGYGGMGYGGMGYGGMGYGGMGYGGMGYGTGYGAPMPGYSGAVNPSTIQGATPVTGTTVTPGAAPTPDLTGSYLGTNYAYGSNARIPHVIPNPFDNTLLIQGTPQEWEQISKLLKQLDIPPRQVLIEAKIYEVDLTGAFMGGVTAYLQAKGAETGAKSPSAGLTRTLMGSSSTDAGLQLTAGLLVGQSRQLLALLSAQENTTRAHVISAPSIIATDSVQASINVGQQVPTLTSQAVASGVQSNGNSVFANSISSQSTGVTLNILARINSSGVVTMMLQQDVSAPQPTTTSSIQSPTFSKRTVSTQVTVQDGDTIAIGGIISESDTLSSGGVPFLHRIPVVGMAFGAKNTSKQRTELIVFLTPHVIYDTNQVADATDALKSGLKGLMRMMKEE